MTKNNVKSNYIYSVLYQILAVILPLITSPYIARTIGATGVGIYSYSYSVSHYFAIFILLGLSNYGSRTIAAVRDNKQKLSKSFWEIYSMQLIFGILFTVMYTIYLVLFCKENVLISALMLIYIFSCVIDINWFFQGLENFKITVTRNFIIKILTVISIFLFVKDKNDIWIYTLIMVSGFLISQLALWPYLRKNVTFIKPKAKDILKHLKPNLVLFVPVIAINVYKYMDKIMLGSIVDVKEVGFYENAEKIIVVAMGFITAFGNVMLPRMSNLYSKGDNKNANKYISLSFHFITIITSSLAFGLTAISNDFSIIFWGNEFKICGILISLLSVSMLFIAWPNIIRTQFLIPTHKEKDYIVSVFIGAIVNFIINLILIKQLGAIGAAIGTIFAEMSVCIYQIIAIRNEFDLKLLIGKNILFIIPGILMLLTIKLFSNFINFGVIKLIAEIFIGIISYFIYVYLFEYLFNKPFLEYIKNKFLKFKYIK